MSKCIKLCTDYMQVILNQFYLKAFKETVNDCCQRTGENNTKHKSLRGSWPSFPPRAPPGSHPHVLTANTLSESSLTFQKGFLALDFMTLPQGNLWNRDISQSMRKYRKIRPWTECKISSPHLLKTGLQEGGRGPSPTRGWETWGPSYHCIKSHGLSSVHGASPSCSHTHPLRMGKKGEKSVCCQQGRKAKPTGMS